LRYKKFGTIAAFSFIPFKNKVASLIYFNNGAVTYYLTTTDHSLFSFINLKKNKMFTKVKANNLCRMLFQIKKLSFISSIELLPGSGSKYSRCPGTKSRIIKFEQNSYSVLIELPSKIKKIFSYYSFALTGSIILPLHKKYNNGKAGY
jgi:ribosomal protein L2